MREAANERSRIKKKQNISDHMISILVAGTINSKFLKYPTPNKQKSKTNKSCELKRAISYVENRKTCEKYRAFAHESLVPVCK
jgi:hypothetical protein